MLPAFMNKVGKAKPARAETGNQKIKPYKNPDNGENQRDAG